MTRYKTLALLLTAVFCAASVLPAAAQQFQLLPFSDIGSIATGSVSVWGTPCCQSSYTSRYDAHSGQFQPVSSLVLLGIAVGGGSVMQADEVWGSDASGNTWRWNASAQTFYPIAGSVQNLVVGAGYSSCHPYEVWGTNSVHLVWRYNFCTNNWESMSAYLSTLATGGGETWGLDAYNQVFRFNPATNQFNLMPGVLTQLSLGASGVWGTNSNQDIWQFNPATQNWDQIPGKLNAISAGGDGVFGYYDNWPYGPYQAYRLDPSTRTWTLVFSTSGGWNQIGQIAVGTGSGIWMMQGLLNTYSYLTF